MRPLEVGLVGEPLILHNLDPVTVRVQDEGHVLHAAVCEALLPVDLHVFKALARRVEVVHRDA